MKPLSIRLDASLMKKLRKYSKKEQRSLANCIRLILEEFFDRSTNE